jgi:hypothetical protein
MKKTRGSPWVSIQPEISIPSGQSSGLDAAGLSGGLGISPPVSMTLPGHLRVRMLAVWHRVQQMIPDDDAMNSGLGEAR